MSVRLQRGLATTFWTLLTVMAVLWPARLVGPLDGAPLDAAVEALVIGIWLPFLWVMHRGFLARRVAQALVIALVAWKATLWLGATQQGLCAHASAGRPLDAVFLQMPIHEPSGVLRSWDVRADFNDPAPECTAIVTRGLPTERDFPAWFVNITDQILDERHIDVSLRGFVTVAEPQPLSAQLGSGVRARGTIGSQPFDGKVRPLVNAVNRVDVALTLTGSDWRFEPRLGSESLWDGALVTVSEPTRVDRWLAPWGWLVSPALTLALVAGWTKRMLSAVQPGARAVMASLALSAVAVALALQPILALRRAIGLLAFAALLVPLGQRARNVRGALLLVGLPWLAFFAAHCFAEIGRFTAFSADDWLAYQLAGYRIFMHGYWLEGGTAAFDYQPLYRWMSGALHLVFGDSSVGEHYWDAACLVTGAMLAYHLVRARAGFRWGLAAAAATLATFSLGTPWYFIGRSLSEIAAAGWAFLAMLLLLRARRGHWMRALGAGTAAVLMFYTRLNHVLYVAFLPALLLPLAAPAVFGRAIRALSRVRQGAVTLYAATVALGFLAIMTRTWYYTGQFSLFHGTSLAYNDTGLRSFDLLSLRVWQRVGHSLASFVFMNEPPVPELRAIVVIIGAVVGIGALCQLPKLRGVPAAIVIAALGASAGSFFAHGHPYPGRFSMHFIPLAAALATLAVAMWFPVPIGVTRTLGTRQAA